METVRQRNIARDWWFAQFDAHKQFLLNKYVDPSKHHLAFPRLYDNNIAYHIFEEETGKKISKL